MSTLKRSLPFRTKSGGLVAVWLLLGWGLAASLFPAVASAADTCKVTLAVESGPTPNPSFTGDTVTVTLKATKNDPTIHAECSITATNYAWEITKVEKSTDGSTYADETTGFKDKDPGVKIAGSGATATLTAKNLPAGHWKVSVKVTVTWTVEKKPGVGDVDCGNCGSGATDTIVVGPITVSGCGAAGELAPEDNFAGRSLTRVGLGEPGVVKAKAKTGVNLADLKPLTWSIKSGGDFISLANIDTDAGTADFTAKKTAGNAVLELTDKNGCKTTLPVAVIAPAAVYHLYDSDHSDSGVMGTTVAYGTLNHVHFRPTDVSFHWISAGEGKDPAADSTGEFARAFGTFPHDENGPTAMTKGDIAKGSRWVPKDQVFSGRINIGGDAGRFVWDIPQQYFDGGGSRVQIHDLEQRFDFDGDKKIRARKGGADKSGP